MVSAKLRCLFGDVLVNANDLEIVQKRPNPSFLGRRCADEDFDPREKTDGGLVVTREFIGCGRDSQQLIDQNVGVEESGYHSLRSRS